MKKSTVWFSSVSCSFLLQMLMSSSCFSLTLSLSLSADFAMQILEAGPNPRAGKKSDQAHPPIHPLKTGQSLNGESTF